MPTPSGRGPGRGRPPLGPRPRRWRQALPPRSGGSPAWGGARSPPGPRGPEPRPPPRPVGPPGRPEGGEVGVKVREDPKAHGPILPPPPSKPGEKEPGSPYGGRVKALALGLLLALTLPPFPWASSPPSSSPSSSRGLPGRVLGGPGVLGAPPGLAPAKLRPELRPLGGGALSAPRPRQGPLLRPPLRPHPQRPHAPRGWVLLEWLTEQGELAFPWGFLGYALVEAPGRILAAWGGVYLLSSSSSSWPMAFGRGGLGSSSFGPSSGSFPSPRRTPRARPFWSRGTSTP